MVSVFTTSVKWGEAADQQQDQSVLTLVLGNGRLEGGLEGRPGWFRAALCSLGQGWGLGLG